MWRLIFKAKIVKQIGTLYRNLESLGALLKTLTSQLQRLLPFFLKSVSKLDILIKIIRCSGFQADGPKMFSSSFRC